MAKIGIGPRGANIHEAMENARRLEDAGFDWISTGEDAFVSGAALATATKKATIGSCVTLLTRSPVQTMQACTALDDLSDGRWVLGLGVGPNEWNRDWHGIDPSRPARRMAEYIQTFRAAWDSRPGAPANFDGEIYHIRDYVRMRRSRSERLPVLVGTVGPLNTRNAGQYGDGAIFDIELPLSYVTGTLMPALLEGARRAGKSRSEITAAALLALSVDPDGAVARRRARHSLLMHIPVHYYQPVWEGAGFSREAAASKDALLAGDIKGAVEALPDEMVNLTTIAGTPDEVRRALRQWDDLLDLMIFVSPSLHLPPDEAAAAYRQATEFLAATIESRGVRR